MPSGISACELELKSVDGVSDVIPWRLSGDSRTQNESLQKIPICGTRGDLLSLEAQEIACSVFVA